MSEPEFGERIRSLRGESNMSLSELARQAQVSKSYLSQIERGQVSRPSAEMLHRLAAVLGSSVAALLGKEIGNEHTEVAVSKTLLKFAQEEGLSEEEVVMLARIRYRGKQAQSVADWRYLHESIKRSLLSGD